MSATSKESMFKSIKSRTAAPMKTHKAIRDDPAALPQELAGVFSTFNEARATAYFKELFHFLGIFSNPYMLLSILV